MVRVAAPSVIKESTSRLVNYNVTYKKPAPFEFILLNKDFNVIEQNDFTLNFKINGQELPDQVYVTYEGRQIKADKEDKQHFTFTFHRIIKNTSFQLMADGFYSEKYELKSVPNPLISAFKIELNYPPYLQKKNETLNNTGDLLIPSGTIVKWTFNTVNTSVFKFPISIQPYK